MKTLSIDVETYSDIDLISCGAYRYADHPSFEVMLVAYSEDYGPVKVVDLANGEKLSDNFIAALTNPDITKTAYNANFERICFASMFGKSKIFEPEQWECTMVLAAQVGLPLSLAEVSAALGLPKDKTKLKSGRDLIRYFCVPCKPTKINGGRTRNLPEHDMEKWRRFKEYNQRDVEAENYIRQKLLPYKPNQTEQNYWLLDQKINDTGVAVDLSLVENAISFDARYKAALSLKATDLTGIENPNSVSQVKDWLNNTEGVEVDSLNKKAMPGVMQLIKTDEAKEFLTLRRELSKSSTKKYDAIARSVCDDGKIRGLFQFYGANRTGRFAGRLVQVQNLPRNSMSDLDLARNIVREGDYNLFELLYDDVSTVLSQLIRTALVPDPGCRFLVADYSAIEARVIAWYAKESWVLKEFAGEGLIYEAVASEMFGVPKDKIVKGNPEYALRQRGKVATLALGYQGGVTALTAMGAIEMGIPEEELATIVQLWRKANKNIVRWWKSLQDAAFEALAEGRGIDPIGGIVFRYSNGHLFMDLPSGRSLCYYQAKVGDNRYGSPSIHYSGLNQVTKKWEQLDTYGGKLAENCVQATARDCLLDAMQRLDQKGFDIRMHIHDEVVINEPVEGRTAKEVCEIMGEPIAWAKDLPLSADGYDTPYYRKD